MEFINIRTNKDKEMIDITNLINKKIEKQQELNSDKHKAIIIQSMHTTAALTINEGFDDDVKHDILLKIKKLTQDTNYKHFEGNSDAHLSTSLFNQSLIILIQNRKMLLGQWQRLFFVEFDGPRDRRIVIDFI